MSSYILQFATVVIMLCEETFEYLSHLYLIIWVKWLDAVPNDDTYMPYWYSITFRCVNM